MKIEFSRAEIERIILDHANSLVPTVTFSDISARYSSIPTSIVVATKEDHAKE
jgi:hypothetical protein